MKAVTVTYRAVKNRKCATPNEMDPFKIVRSHTKKSTMINLHMYYCHCPSSKQELLTTVMLAYQSVWGKGKHVTPGTTKTNGGDTGKGYENEKKVYPILYPCRKT